MICIVYDEVIDSIINVFIQSIYTFISQYFITWDYCAIR